MVCETEPVCNFSRFRHNKWHEFRFGIWGEGLWLLLGFVGFEEVFVVVVVVVGAFL